MTLAGERGEQRGAGTEVAKGLRWRCRSSQTARRAAQKAPPSGVGGESEGNEGAGNEGKGNDSPPQASESGAQGLPLF